MYNGIGLQTPRGSGTNGYVQKNLAFITNTKEKVPYKFDDDLNKKNSMFKEPNKDILFHEKKRKIEVKCYEMSKSMEDQGYSELEIDEKVIEYRKALLAELANAKDVVGLKDSLFYEDGQRRIPKGTHEINNLNKLKNDVFKNALGISKDFQDGTSMEVAHKRRMETELSKKLHEAQKDLSVLQSSDEDDDSKSTKRSKKKKKRKSKSSKKENSSKKHKKRKHVTSSSSSSSSSEDSDNAAEDSDSADDTTKKRKHRHKSSKRSKSEKSSREDVEKHKKRTKVH